MLITVNVTHTLQESIELALPAFFSDPLYVYMIAEDETIFQVTREATRSAVIMTWGKDNPYHGDHIKEAIGNQPINEYEFMKSWNQAVDYFESKMKPNVPNTSY